MFCVWCLEAISKHQTLSLKKLNIAGLLTDKPDKGIGRFSRLMGFEWFDVLVMQNSSKNIRGVLSCDQIKRQPDV